MGSSWSVEQAPSLTGKVAIVTGANSGLGLVTALEIARLGAHVIVAARNEESSRKAVADIQKQTGNQQVEFMKLDLASLRSVKAFADAFRAKGLPLHILVNNAGVMAIPRTLTEDGNEMQFQTNHLGHFLLTVLLEDILERSAPARVVNVSSSMHWSPYSGGVRFDDLTGEQYYRPWWAYGQSKLCNVLFTHELARRLADKQIFVNATHPGYAATNLQSGSWFLSNVLNPLFSSSPEKGARSQLFAAVAPEVERNNIRAEYIGPPAAIQRQSAYAKNVDLQKRLWEVSRELVRPFLSESALQFAS